MRDFLPRVGDIDDRFTKDHQMQYYKSIKNNGNEFRRKWRKEAAKKNPKCKPVPLEMRRLKKRIPTKETVKVYQEWSKGTTGNGTKYAPNIRVDRFLNHNSLAETLPGVSSIIIVFYFC